MKMLLNEYQVDPNRVAAHNNSSQYPAYNNETLKGIARALGLSHTVNKPELVQTINEVLSRRPLDRDGMWILHTNMDIHGLNNVARSGNAAPQQERPGTPMPPAPQPHRTAAPTTRSYVQSHADMIFQVLLNYRQHLYYNNDHQLYQLACEIRNAGTVVTAGNFPDAVRRHNLTLVLNKYGFNTNYVAYFELMDKLVSIIIRSQDHYSCQIYPIPHLGLSRLISNAGLGILSLDHQLLLYDLIRLRHYQVADLVTQIKQLLSLYQVSWNFKLQTDLVLLLTDNT